MPEQIHEHQRVDKYIRYHKDVFLPGHILKGATDFLPPAYTPLRLSKSYLGRMDDRHLPPEVYMPRVYEIIDVTVIRDTWAVFRVMIQFRWTSRKVGVKKQSDFVIVLDGDYEVVTGFWLRQGQKPRVDNWEVYEQAEGS